jgi:galactose-1-phosphate uridylyltransferase
MSEEDCVIVMSRLAATENKLFSVGREIRKTLKFVDDRAGDEFYISIIKNSGSAVGGSLEHGHQQILLSNLAPRRLLDNQRFEKGTGITFSEHLQVSNPTELLLRDYGDAVLVVSKFMRRPLEMILALKDTIKSYLHQLDVSELIAVSRGWMDATHVFTKLMPDFDRDIAYNIVTHNGPGSGLYFEFLPYTQEQGGFEQLGLAVCHADPLRTADQIRNILKG